MDVCGYTYMSWVVRSLQRHKTAGWEVIRKLGIFTFREKEHHDSNIVQKQKILSKTISCTPLNSPQ